MKSEGHSPALEYRPLPPQERVIAELCRDPLRGVFADPGSGKSAIVLAAFAHKRARFEARRMLIVAPVQVCAATWPAEVRKWRQFREFRVRHIVGTPKQRLDIMRAPAEIYLINPELVPWLVDQAWDWPDMLVVDESHRFKSLGTRWKALRKRLDMFDHRCILTGTPAPNGLVDLWAQAYIVDKGKALGATKSAYLSDFFACISRGQWSEWVPKRGSEPLIYQALKPIVSRISREELALDVPDPIVIERAVKLPPSAAETYKRLKTDLVLEFEAGDVVAPSAGALFGKLRQAANGRLYLSDDLLAGDDAPAERPFEVLHDAKLEALESLVDELGGKPVVIVYAFRHDLAALRTLYPKAPVIGAGAKPADVARVVERWNAGEVPVLLLHPASGGTGLNLQAGGHSIAWYGLPVSLEEYQQTNARLWRQGQAATVRIYHVVAENTIDQRIGELLRAKDATQRGLLNALVHDLGVLFG